MLTTLLIPTVPSNLTERYLLLDAIRRRDGATAVREARSALALGLRILRAQRREVAAEPLYVRRWHNLGDQRCPACKSITGHASWCDR